MVFIVVSITVCPVVEKVSICSTCSLVSFKHNYIIIISRVRSLLALLLCLAGVLILDTDLAADV